MTYLSVFVRPAVLERMGKPASPEEYAVKDEREWHSSSSGQHPPGVLEIQLVSALDPARMAGPGWVYLRYYTVEKVVWTNLQAIAKDVEYLIAVLPAQQMLDILHTHLVLRFFMTNFYF